MIRVEVSFGGKAKDGKAVTKDGLVHPGHRDLNLPDEGEVTNEKELIAAIKAAIELDAKARAGEAKPLPATGIFGEDGQAGPQGLYNVLVRGLSFVNAAHVRALLAAKYGVAKPKGTSSAAANSETV